MKTKFQNIILTSLLSILAGGLNSVIQDASAHTRITI